MLTQHAQATAHLHACLSQLGSKKGIETEGIEGHKKMALLQVPLINLALCIVCTIEADALAQVHALT